MSRFAPSRRLVTGDPCHRSYVGDTSPRNWGTLAENGGSLCFPLCADSSTSKQSPIDIQTDAIIADPTLPTLGFSYSSTPVNVTDGHNNFTAHYPTGRAAGSGADLHQAKANRTRWGVRRFPVRAYLPAAGDRAPGHHTDQMSAVVGTGVDV